MEELKKIFFVILLIQLLAIHLIYVCKHTSSFIERIKLPTFLNRDNYRTREKKIMTLFSFLLIISSLLAMNHLFSLKLPVSNQLISFIQILLLYFCAYLIIITVFLNKKSQLRIPNFALKLAMLAPAAFIVSIFLSIGQFYVTGRKYIFSEITYSHYLVYFISILTCVVIIGECKTYLKNRDKVEIEISHLMGLLSTVILGFFIITFLSKNLA